MFSSFSFILSFPELNADDDAFFRHLCFVQNSHRLTILSPRVPFLILTISKISFRAQAVSGRGIYRSAVILFCILRFSYTIFPSAKPSECCSSIDNMMLHAKCCFSQITIFHLFFFFIFSMFSSARQKTSRKKIKKQ
jgi:hypothetical protein